MFFLSHISLDQILEDLNAQALQNNLFLVRGTRKNEKLLKRAIRHHVVFLPKTHSEHSGWNSQKVGKPQMIEVTAQDQNPYSNLGSHVYHDYGYVIAVRQKPVRKPTIWVKEAAAVPHW